MYVTNVTVLRGDRGLTEVTPYDILEAVHRVLHGQASRFLVVMEIPMLKNRNRFLTQDISCRKTINNCIKLCFTSRVKKGHFGSLSSDLLLHTVKLEKCIFIVFIKTI